MNVLGKTLGLTAACAACCAIPLLLPGLAALGLGGVLAALGRWEVGAGVLLVLGVAMLGIRWRRQRTAQYCRVPEGSGRP